LPQRDWESRVLGKSLIGGKRLRPILCFLVFRACGGKNKDKRKALDICVSIELAHNASLIHDDIIDKDRLRRDDPTVWISEGVGEAILIGHRAITTGLETITNYGLDMVKTFLFGWDSASRGALEEAVAQDTPTAKAYFEVIGQKTARLFASAAKLGAQIAGVNEELTNAMEEYGLNLGIAYQLADDWVDLTKGETSRLPLVSVIQFERKLREDAVRFMLERKLYASALREIINRDAPRFFKREIRHYVSKAELLAEKAPSSRYKPLLREMPSWCCDRMLSKIGVKVWD